MRILGATTLIRWLSAVALATALGCDASSSSEPVEVAAIKPSRGNEVERCCERHFHDRRRVDRCLFEAARHRGVCAPPPNARPDAGSSNAGVGGRGIDAGGSDRGSTDADAASGTGGQMGAGGATGVGGAGGACFSVISITPPQTLSTLGSRATVDVLLSNFDPASTFSFGWEYGGLANISLSPTSATFECQGAGIFTVSVSYQSACFQTASTTITCLPVCGDRVIDGEEQCDPPHTDVSGPQCGPDCRFLTCGNGVIDPGEQCDFPEGGFCSPTCQLVTCGNGLLDPGEECDPPLIGFCSETCQNLTAVCGDGHVGPGEQCDPPHTGPEGLQCGPDCRYLTCGNGILDAGEQCDPPHPFGPVADRRVCTQTCQIPEFPRCGNFVVDSGEQCDPPDLMFCDAECQAIPLVCGNGIIQEPSENCENATALFCKNCVRTVCGGCFEQVCPNAEATCKTLQGADRTNCQVLENCVVNCPVKPGPFEFDVGCFCSDPSSCSSGPDGRCGPQLAALLNTSDGATIVSAVHSSPTLLGLALEIRCLETTGCGGPCARQAP
jgi:hypothetical protein